MIAPLTRTYPRIHDLFILTEALREISESWLCWKGDAVSYIAVFPVYDSVQYIYIVVCTTHFGKVYWTTTCDMKPAVSSYSRHTVHVRYIISYSTILSIINVYVHHTLAIQDLNFYNFIVEQCCYLIYYLEFYIYQEEDVGKTKCFDDKSKDIIGHGHNKFLLVQNRCRYEAGLGKIGDLCMSTVNYNR